MKKFFLILISAVLCISFVACGNTDDSNDIRESIRQAIWIKANSALQFNFQGTKLEGSYVDSQNITCYINQTDDLTYEVSGKVTVRDRYGDTYTGNYDAVVYFDTDGDVDVASFDLPEFEKD